ncbi:hypothetical protein PGB90_005475 [Kerria lacca]
MVENEKTLNSIDIKREESYCTVTNALANASKESIHPLVSLITERALNGTLNERHSLEENDLAHVSSTRIRNFNFSQRTNSNREIFQSRDIERVYSMESDLNDASTFVTAKVELDNLNSRSKYDRDYDEKIFNGFDYRFRYGLSSLEIYSKCGSRKNKTANCLSKTGNYSVFGNDKVFYETSSAAAFFARYAPFVLFFKRLNSI